MITDSEINEWKKKEDLYRTYLKIFNRKTSILRKIINYCQTPKTISQIQKISNKSYPTVWRDIQYLKRIGLVNLHKSIDHTKKSERNNPVYVQSINKEKILKLIKK